MVPLVRDRVDPPVVTKFLVWRPGLYALVCLVGGVCVG